MKGKLLLIGLLAAVLGICYGAVNGSQASADEKKKLIRVGVYDSRAIPVAYTYSQYNDHFMQKTSKQKKEAETQGDIKKVQELENQMKRYALKRHKQVFSTIPVCDLLDLVKKNLPEVARQADVSLIVSKWQIDYLASDIEVVDVTLEVAKLFNPKSGILESIPELIKKEPITEKEIERLEEKYPH